MATLAVRTLRARDLPRLRGVGPRVERLDGPVCRFRHSVSEAATAWRAFAGVGRREHPFVATVDGELCAYLVAQEQPRNYLWELVTIAAGSSRLTPTDDVSVELWTALIEFAVQQAGRSGAKRLFASARRDSPAFDSLKANGFGAFEDRFVLTGDLSQATEMETLAGLREQLESDVWSIHQLYHQTTPRAVQFAEALTSSEWEPEPSIWWQRIAKGVQQFSFVLDSEDGVKGYCRIQRRQGRAMATFIGTPHCADRIAELILSSARLSGVGPNDVLQVVVPGYAMEHVSSLERYGFHVAWERIGMVKHTTAPVVVRPRLVPVAAGEERERAIRGVPSLFQGP